MEKVVMNGPREETSPDDAKKLLIMRALASLHECDVETLWGVVDASEPDFRDVLREMVSRNEIEVSKRHTSGGRHNEKLALTLRGRGEYMQLLGSIYELQE